MCVKCHSPTTRNVTGLLSGNRLELGRQFRGYLSAVLHLYAGDRDSIMTSTLFVLTH